MFSLAWHKINNESKGITWVTEGNMDTFGCCLAMRSFVYSQVYACMGINLVWRVCCMIITLLNLLVYYNSMGIGNIIDFLVCMHTCSICHYYMTSVTVLLFLYKHNMSYCCKPTYSCEYGGVSFRLEVDCVHVQGVVWIKGWRWSKCFSLTIVVS